MIIDTYIDRISRTSPMNRCVTVAGLRHGADIDYLDLICVRLRFYGIHDVLSGGRVYFQGLFREIIRRRRNHSTYV